MESCPPVARPSGRALGVVINQFPHWLVYSICLQQCHIIQFSRATNLLAAFASKCIAFSMLNWSSTCRCLRLSGMPHPEKHSTSFSDHEQSNRILQTRQYRSVRLKTLKTLNTPPHRVQASKSNHETWHDQFWQQSTLQRVAPLMHLFYCFLLLNETRGYPLQLRRSSVAFHLCICCGSHCSITGPCVHMCMCICVWVCAQHFALPSTEHASILVIFTRPKDV